VSPIRILHVSDMHLAAVPQRHSVLDKQAAVRDAAKKALAADVKAAIASGKAGDFSKAFQNVLDGDSIALLQRASSGVDKAQIYKALDSALNKIVTSDKSLSLLAAEALRDLTFASSYNPGALDCLCNFIEDQESRLNAIIITGDLATTGLEPDLEKARAFLEGDPDVAPEFDQTIAHVKLPVFVLPGNHDRYQYTGKGFFVCARRRSVRLDSRETLD